MSGKIGITKTSSEQSDKLLTKQDLTIEEELFQAADKKIVDLNKLGVAQGRTDIAEPEQQHLPVLLDLGDFKSWLRDAEPYVIDKRLKKTLEEMSAGKKIEVEDILEDVTKTGKKCSSVMVLAPAGNGKTTLLKRIAQKARQGKFKELKGKLVLVLDFRPHLKEKEVLPSQVLLGEMFSDWGSERMKQRYQWIIDNPEKVVFIIDSLDTLPFDLEKEDCPRPRTCPEYHKATPAHVILRDILAKDWFPESKIISSSREYKVRNLHPSFRPDRCVVLDGLTEESVKDLIDGFLGKERGAEVKRYIETECPEILPLLSIPVFLVFFMICFGPDGFQPKTMSGILIKFFLSLIRSQHAHVKDISTVLSKLMPLAFDGTRTLLVLFEPKYLKRFHLEPEEVTDLVILIQQSQGTYLSTKLMQNDGFLLYFNHQTLQEALAALHVLSLCLTEFRTFLQNEVWKPQFTVVRRLICGTLFNHEVLEAAQELTEISDVDQKKNSLIQSLGDALEKHQQGRNGKELLELFIDLSECGEGVTEVIRSSVKKLHFISTPLSPSAVQAVAFVMKQCVFLQDVILVHCSLNGEKMKILTKTIMKSNVKFDIFDVSSNEELGIEGAHLLGKLVKNQGVRSLVASDKSIRKCEALKKFIEGLGDAKFKKFDVNNNDELGVEGAHLLGELVKNHGVRCLNASRGSIRDSEALKKFIEGLGDAKLKEFRINGNKELGIEGAHLLGKLVKNNEVETLAAENGSIRESEALKKFIEGLGDAKINYLHLLDYSKPPYTRSLLDLLTHVKEKLILQNWKINENQQQEIQQRLNEIGSPSLEVKIGSSLNPVFLQASLMDSTSRIPNDDSETGESIANLPTTTGQPEDYVKPRSAAVEGQENAPVEIAAKISAEIERRIKTESTQSKMIGADGGVVVNIGSKVTFFHEAFNKDTKVQTSVITDFSDCPKDRIPIAPSIKCSPSGKLNKPALVEIDHWVFPTDDNVYAEIYRKDNEDSERLLFKKIRLQANQKISFYTDHFTLYEFVMKYASMLWSGLTRPFAKFTLQNLVYISGVNQSIACVCCLQNAKVEEDVTRTLKNSHFRPLLPAPETTFACQGGDVKVKIECDDPDNLHIRLENARFVKEIENVFLVSTISMKCQEFHYLPITLQNGDLKRFDGVLRFQYSHTAEQDNVRHQMQIVWPIPGAAPTHLTNVENNLYGDIKTDTLLAPHQDNNQ